VDGRLVVRDEDSGISEVSVDGSVSVDLISVDLLCIVLHWLSLAVSLFLQPSPQLAYISARTLGQLAFGCYVRQIVVMGIPYHPEVSCLVI